MTDELVSRKAEEALSAAGGDKHDAQKLLITWAIRDPELLLGLTKPHLKAIAAALLDHTVRLKGATPDAGPDHIGRTAIDEIVAAASLKVPLEKRKKTALPPPKTTERQANAMRRLAAAFSKKDDKDR